MTKLDIAIGALFASGWSIPELVGLLELDARQIETSIRLYLNAE